MWTWWGYTDGPRCSGSRWESGRSLKAFLSGERTTTQDYVLGEYYGKYKWIYPAPMLLSKHFKDVKYLAGPEELFDRVSDPDECVNQISNPLCLEIRNQMEAALESELARHADPFHVLPVTNPEGDFIKAPDIQVIKSCISVRSCCSGGHVTGDWSAVCRPVGITEPDSRFRS